jgi:hypothetical protein
VDVSTLDAIDVHTHVHRSVAAASPEAGQALEAMAAYFKTDAAAYTVDELAQYYRDRNMAAVSPPLGSGPRLPGGPSGTARPRAGWKLICSPALGSCTLINARQNGYLRAGADQSQSLRGRLQAESAR